MSSLDLGLARLLKRTMSVRFMWLRLEGKRKRKQKNKKIFWELGAEAGPMQK